MKSSTSFFSFFPLGEAAHLARDFHYVCDQEFPARQCAEHVHRTYHHTHHLHEPCGITKRKQHILAAKSLETILFDLQFEHFVLF